jgi:hypothetical protein
MAVVNPPDEPSLGKQPPKSDRSSPTEEARQLVKEYADDLREIIKKLRRLLH